MVFGKQSLQGYESNRRHADGVRLENISRNHGVGPRREDSQSNIVKEIQQMMGELQCEPENFTGRIIFMLMFNDIVWDSKGNDEKCENNSKTIKQYARGFLRGHWSFPGPGSENTWYGTYDHKPGGSWDRTAEKMLLSFAETGHPIFRGTSALGRGELRSKEGGKSQYTSMVVMKTSSCFSEK